MKTVIILVLATVATSLAQGDLNPPPGGPQPSMKTLQQVEPRIDLFNAPTNLVSTDDPNFYYEIKAPGSYYLSRNASAGGLAIGATAKPSLIKISADDVTLDLNGFQLRGASSALPSAVVADTAVRVDADSVRIHNGAITGFKSGIYASGSGSLISHIRVSDCQEIGITAGGGGSIVTHCTATRCTVKTSFSPAGVITGATISHCTLRDCVVAQSGRAGFYAGSISYCTITGLTGGGSVYGILSGSVSHCDIGGIEGASNATGIFLGFSGAVSHCNIFGVTAPHLARGISESLGECLISDCKVKTVSGGQSTIGIQASKSSVVSNCMTVEIESSGGIALGFALGTGASAGTCTAKDCWIGFRVSSSSLRDCSATEGATGFEVNGDSDLTGCAARDNTVGFDLTDTEGGAVLRDCIAADNTPTVGSGFGFLIAGNRNRLIGCQADRNNSNFVVTGDNNHLDGCVAIATAIGGGRGFLTTGNNNTVIRCSAKNCSTNFSLNASTKAGPIVNDPTNATNPFANFDN